MACAPCYTTFLDNNPDIRSAIHDFLDNMVSLPVEALDIELTSLGDFIDDLSSQIDDIETDVLGLDLLESDIGDAMTLAGVSPGDCPQLDAAIAGLQGLRSILNIQKNPLTKTLDGLQGRLAQVSSLAAAANNLVANAEGWRC